APRTRRVRAGRPATSPARSPRRRRGSARTCRPGAAASAGGAARGRETPARPRAEGRPAAWPRRPLSPGPGPLAEHVGEGARHLRRCPLLGLTAQHTHCDPHLLDVRLAPVAGPEVVTNALELGAGQRALQVIGDDFDQLVARHLLDHVASLPEVSLYRGGPG